jgi:ribosomal protein S18 acetylase RimI-like enzyme
MEKRQNLLIREASTDDAPIIALLARLTFGETFGHYFRDPNDLLDYYERTFSVAKIASGLSKRVNVFWLAFVNDLPVGYGKLKLSSDSPFIDSTKVCQLQKIYVLKDFLSQKIGHQLQNHLLSKAKMLGFEHVWLSVLQSNERAIHFYLKNGFQRIGQHEYSIGKEDFEFWVMRKRLL